MSVALWQRDRSRRETKVPSYVQCTERAVLSWDGMEASVCLPYHEAFPVGTVAERRTCDIVYSSIEACVHFSIPT